MAHYIRKNVVMATVRVKATVVFTVRVIGTDTSVDLIEMKEL